MSRVAAVVACDGLGGFWNDDNEAIKRNARQDGFSYRGQPVTAGFIAVRQPAKAVCVTLILENGELAFGDCVWVQYGGERAGREKLASFREVAQVIDQHIKPRLIGRELDSFRSVMADFDDIPLPRAVKYGVSQAVLDAIAKTKRETMAQVLASEYGTTIMNEPIVFFTQCGDEYYYSVDKMILRRIPVFPHGLINSVSRLKRLPDYVKWTKRRIRHLVPEESYNPILHYDLYGTLGLAYRNKIERIAGYLRKLEEMAKPFRLQIEDPIYMSTKKNQVEMMSRLKKLMMAEGLATKLVVDEWAPTLEDKIDFIRAGAGDLYQIKPPDLGGINRSVEAILYCKSQGVGPYLGGSCAETSRSAEVSVHIALATRPVQVLAKPGMGVDEGVSIMYNEAQRALALIFSHS